MKEIIAAVLEVVGAAEEFRPAIQKALKAVSSYGPEVYEFAEGVCRGSVDLRAMMVKRFQEEHGFTREEAIMMTKDQWGSFSEAVKKVKK